MPPKKTLSPKPKSSVSGHSYQVMITDAIIALKERNGSSRIKLKKYLKANYDIGQGASEPLFEANFKKALRAGVEKGIFTQPKGPSGGVKLANKATKPTAAAITRKAPAAPKAETKDSDESEEGDTPKKAPVKKEAAKKETARKAAPKKAVVKKVTAKEPIKKAATKASPKAAPKVAPKAAPRKKAAAPKKADAVEDKPTVLTKTKSGRITKTTATLRMTPAKRGKAKAAEAAA